MQETNQRMTDKANGKPIGGWLSIIMIMLIATSLSVIIDIVSTIEELLADDWSLYFETTDHLLKTRINIYAFIIISLLIALGLLIWNLNIFFHRKKKFPAVFLGLLGYFILTEVLRLYFLDYYAGLTDQGAVNFESTLAKTGVIAIIAGLYLNKGKRPKETFVN